MHPIKVKTAPSFCFFFSILFLPLFLRYSTILGYKHMGYSHEQILILFCTSFTLTFKAMVTHACFWADLASKHEMSIYDIL